MLRYIALIWDPDDPDAVNDARERAARLTDPARPWRAVIDTAGLMLFVSLESRQVPIQNFPIGCGTILGSLFNNPGQHPEDPVPEPVRLAFEEAQQIILSGGKSLLSGYWGDYVAVFREWSSSAVRIVRGPGATIPCLRLPLERMQLYGSDMECLEAISDRRFFIDWDELALSLIGPQLPYRTHLHGVNEVPPGYCERVFQGITRREMLWNPVEIAQAPFAGDFDDAARALRRTLRACIQARAAEFSRIAVALSGGLDSSIVLACLADAPSRPEILCLTQYSAGTDSDERKYARLSATRADCMLWEYPRDANLDFRTGVHHRRLELNPGLRTPAIDRIEPDFCRSHGAQAIFYGHGGDEINLRNELPLFVGDYLRTHGWGKELPSLLMHAAYTEGSTVFRILARIMQDNLFRASWNLTTYLSEEVRNVTLLRAEVLTRLERSPPPSLYALDDPRLSRARQWQISLLCARRAIPGPFDRFDDPPQISPFLSQPVVELSIRIPTWYQMRGRRDRALARAAFQQDLAPEVYARRDKGEAEALAFAIVEANFPFLRETLLDGVIAQSGLIDRRRLEAAIGEQVSDELVTSVPLFDLLGAELWARAWQATPAHQNLSPKDSRYNGSSSAP